MTRRFTWIIMLIGLLSSITAQATDYYWKGGSGNYNDPAMWWLYSYNSGTTAIQAPVSTDNVYFDAAAFTTPGAIININANANCHDMIWDDAILAANQPNVTSATSVRLDIYGSLSFATQLDWQYRGSIRFRSTSLLTLIDTKGHVLKTANVYFSGSDSTEFRLMNALNMANINISVYSGIQLNRGYLNANGFDLNINSIHLGRNSSQNPLGAVPDNSIGLNVENCIVNVYRIWWTGVNRSKFHTFNTTNSHLKFIKSGNAFRAISGFGFDTVSTYNNSRFDGSSPTIDHLFSYGRLEFYRNSKPIIEDWHIGGAIPLVELYYQNNWITVERIFMPNECDKYVTIQRRPNPSGTQRLIKKSPNDTLFLERVILQDILCDASSGRTYIANNSIDAGGNDPAWQFTTSGGRSMYFRATTDNVWSNPNNWEIWDGTMFSPNLGNCLPTPIDHVYFDDLSFTGTDSIVVVDSIAYCHDVYWFDNVRPNASIYFRQDLNTFGSARLSTVMSTIK